MYRVWEEGTVNVSQWVLAGLLNESEQGFVIDARLDHFAAGLELAEMLRQ